MSVILAGTVRFDPAKFEASQPRMQEMMRLSRAEDGCVAYTYAQDLEDPGLIHVFEIWRDGDAVHAHHNAPHFLAWRADREALGMSDRRMSPHEVSSSQET